jgi:PAS domain S-box-containing protein
MSLTVTGRSAGGVESADRPTLRALADSFDEMRARLRQAREELAVEKSRYQRILESMADAVVTTDVEGRITDVNPAAQQLTGWDRPDVEGRPVVEVLSVSDQPNGCAPILPALGVVKGLLRRRDGRMVAVSIAGSPIHGDNDAIRGAVYVLRDISADEELSRLKDEFLSTVSHELRAPLGAIKGYARTLLLEPAEFGINLTTERFLSVIVEASDDLEELVDNLLDISKIGAGTLTITPRPVRLHRLTRRALARLRMCAWGHRIQLAVPADLRAVHADAHRVEQVLTNLLDNAIKYTPEGGMIVVAAECLGAEVVMSVADDGPGIPADELGKLFDRFQRGRSERVRRVGGSGLGLAICKGIVEAHGGRIWAESPVDAGALPAGRAELRPAGPGTVVRFTLPVAGRQRAATARSPRAVS